MAGGARIYNLFPSLVGPIEAWIGELDRIAAMGFDWVYVNPFHATGYSGSLYAVKDYYRLNPLFRGASRDSDDELIARFAAEARCRGISVMMDLVVNHTARDCPLTALHPGWYRRAADGTPAAPGAADPDDPSKVTVWTDLAELAFDAGPEREEIAAFFAGVVRHHARLGITGFRCDAAYKVPASVWRTLTRAARAEQPSALFAAETLGAQPAEVQQLAGAGFDYLFNSSKWWDFRASWLLEQYDAFRRIAPSIAFPESHDTPRLIAELGDRPAAEIEAEYRFRYLFAAFFSRGVMMPIGYEFGYARKLDVVMTRPQHREQPRFDLSAFVAEVNAMKAAVPALNDEGEERAVFDDEGAVALLRSAEHGSSVAVALLNPDPVRERRVDGGRIVTQLSGSGPPVDVTPEAGAARALDAAAEVVLHPLEIRVLSAAAAERADRRADARPVVVHAVRPQIDGGRYAVKRVAGERLGVQADVFREGHDLVCAALRHRRVGEAWRETRMAPVGNDRWSASFVPDRVGRYEYAVTGWPDAFGTWRRELRIKRDAGEPIASELLEGRALVAQAAARAGAGARAALEAALGSIDAAPNDAERAERLLDDALAAAMDAAADRSHATDSAVFPLTVDRARARTGAWYELFVRSQGTTPGVAATFAQAAQRLPALAALGFDVVYLAPIHPIGRSARKGRNNALRAAPDDPGSPWAIGNEHGGHTAVEPALGTLDDFDAFVRAAGDAGLEVALDYALQCSPDHPWVREHPEWFAFRPDGTLKYAENPPKKYQDVVNFNWYGPHAPALWDALRDVVLFWLGHGVRIFRVDNPHTKPFAFWEWMIADVRERHPDAVFLAEAFTRPKVMQELAKRGFSQSYTYFTWRNFKGELTDYVRELAHGEMAEYYRPNFFANTPDILPAFLQTGGRPAFLIRLVLAATLSGSYGIYSGFELCENAALPDREEYAYSEKYEIKVRDWNAPGNLNAEIARINRIRREHPALHDWRNVRFLDSGDGDVLFYRKRTGTDVLLIAVNLDPFAAHEARLVLPDDELPPAARGRDAGPLPCIELLAGKTVRWYGSVHTVRLDPQRNPAAIYHVDQRLLVDFESPSD